LTTLHRTPPSRLAHAIALTWAATASVASAQTLTEVVVSASRAAQQTFDAPAAVQAVGRDTLEAAGPQVNLSESMNRIPGITVLNRQNYAQDLQLSIRGSGSRSPFGIRGSRLIVDGIPATMPDGQGQASTVSLSSAQRIEVLRGPLAQMYGNSSAGVVQVFTADGPATPEVGASVFMGSDGMRKIGLNAGGQTGKLNYVLDYTRFETDGYRDHSAAERRQLNAKLRVDATEQTQVTVVMNLFDQPLSLDPLGLTRAQFEANPRQAVKPAYDQDASKVVSQNQLGVVALHKLDATRNVTVTAYHGTRDLDNKLSIPLSAQTPATSAGGAVNLDRQFQRPGRQVQPALGGRAGPGRGCGRPRVRAHVRAAARLHQQPGRAGCLEAGRNRFGHQHRRVCPGHLAGERAVEPGGRAAQQPRQVWGGRSIHYHRQPE
jgi:iron complex outermembrane receptor protein